MELYPKELLKTNDPPPEEIVQRVKIHLQTARQIKENAVKEKEREIGLLEQLLEDIYEQMDEHITSLEKYEAILSPARRLPVDILHYIFYHCLPTHRNPIMSAQEAPMLLTRVCSTWRAVAFSSPRLWSKIRISFAYSSTPEVDRKGAVIDSDKILRMRCNAVKEWLDRSGSCPISISIYHTGTEEWRLGTRQDPNDMTVASTLELFKTITALSDRWEEIELVMPSEVYFRLEPMVSIDNISSLRTVRILLDRNSIAQERDWDGPGCTLLKAPNIREISLVGYDHKLWRPTMAPWSHLTSFSCRTPSSFYDSFQLLTKCQNLIHCTLRLLVFVPTVETLQFHGTAFLPHLQTLFIIGKPSQRRATTKFLGRINAPRLVRIGYEGPEIMEQLGELEDAPFPFLSLLELSKIRSLTIDPQLLSNMDELAIILRLSNNITDLFIGRRLDSLSKPDHNPLSSFDYLGLFNLLTIDPKTCHSAEQTVVLPNLQAFTASVNRTVSKDTVLQFINSRCDPSSSLGTAVLKSVSIALRQRRPRNVYTTHESLVLGNAFGVQVQTDFEFLTTSFSSHAAYDAFFSPTYGLRQLNDRSSLSRR